MRAIRARKPAVKDEKPAVENQPAAPKKKPRAAKPIGLKPRVSEKAYGLSDLRNTYIFDVQPGFNKFDVASAVAAQFDVTVTGVRLATVPGKSIRVIRQKGRRSLLGRRSDVRKAYVTLKEGDNLPIFTAAEEPEAPNPSTGPGRRETK